MASNRIVLVGLFAAAAGASACMSVQRVQPALYFERYAPPVVWVTYAGNTLVPVNEPEIRRDTLRGVLQGARVKIPLREIQSVEAKAPNHARTALLVTGLGVAAVSSFYFLIAQSGGSGGGNGEVYCPPDVRGRPVNFC
jgi:hypothetical protein